MPKILFVCTENSCRSIIAEAAVKALLDTREFEATSAGTEPAETINPKAVRFIREMGWKVPKDFPEKLNREAVNEADIIITMGCIRSCPILPPEKTVDWGLPDPSDLNYREFRKIGMLIIDKVRNLGNTG